MENKPDISIVIVSYNVKELLLKCISSVVSFAGDVNYEIIVVDNNSVDGSPEAIKGHSGKIHVIENKFNAGFSAANNQGMRMSKGEYIFLLNPDTEITGDAIQQLKKYLNEHKNCAMVGPQLLNSDKSIQISAWKNHTFIDLVLETFFLNRIFSALNYPVGKLKTTFEAKTLSGAALFFRKSLTDSMGMLDENLFWMEDIDFCYRAHIQGSIIYLHTAQVVHHSGQSQKKSYNLSIANQLISKLKYYKKHSTMAAVFIAHIACFIFITTRIAALSLLMPFGPIYKLKLQAYIYTLQRYFMYLFLNDKRLT